MSEANELQRLIVEVLAATDAVWRTPRITAQPRGYKAIRTIRDAYRKHGVRWRIGGEDAERKAGERLLAEAERLGLLTSTKLKGPNSALHVRLTPTGEWAARALANCNWLPEAFERVRQIADIDPDDWVTEFDIEDLPTEPEQYGRKSWTLEVEIAPALTAGLLEQNCSTRGEAFYRLTAAGRAALLQGPPECPLHEDDIPGPIVELAEVFCDRMNHERNRFQTMPDPDPSEVGLVPLSAAMGSGNV